jgi:arylsulfatase A-like enzyme
VKVLFLVLDGLSPRHVEDELMPVLASLAREGGWCRDGCIGVMPSSTYPNHATFVTGADPSAHGLVANDIPGDHGPVPSWELGVRVPTLFDVMSEAGRPSAAVFGDQHLVGATGARQARFRWPRDEPDAAVARDMLGYAKDRETAPVVVDACRQGAELVVAQLNQTDTMAHIFGPDSDEALGQYGRSDSHVGSIVAPLRDEWDEWAVIIVSDHSQETVTEPEPIDLHGEARHRGLEGLVLDDGAAAVAGGDLARDAQWMTEVAGVEGIQRIDATTVLAWCAAGRYFSSQEIPVRGVHGSPRTTPQVAVVAGGHPAAIALAGRISESRPTSTSWAPAVAQMLGLPAPSGARSPDGRSQGSLP